MSGGDVDIRFSQFGATSIPVDLLAGPEGFAAYATTLEERSELLDPVWCEGAALVDYDQRELLFYENSGNHFFSTSPGLRRRYHPYLMMRWPSWKVAWAAEGLSELEARAGLTVHPVEAWPVLAVDLPEVEQSLGVVSHIFDWPYSSTKYREGVGEDAFFGDQPYQENLLSVRFQSGRVGDFTSCLTVENLLGLGPRLLEFLDRQEKVLLPNELCVGQGGWLDAKNRELTFWWGGIREAGPIVKTLAELWPGYQVRVHFEGFPRQVRASGREESTVYLPNENVARQVAQLFSFSPDDAREIMGRYVRRIAAEGAQAIVIPRTALEPGSVDMDRKALGKAIIEDVLQGSPR